jgi:2-iminobutanoate/2-iminopropanoate deaminase
MSEIKTILSKNAPKPAGHYSQAVVHNGTIYIAGQLAITSDGEKLVNATVGEQTACILRNVEAILKEAGSALNRVLQMTIYISDGDDWDEVNQAYTRIMGDHKPARAVVPVKDLHYGLKIEVQVIAAV